jgi:hypothetical protein
MNWLGFILQLLMATAEERELLRLARQLARVRRDRDKAVLALRAAQDDARRTATAHTDMVFELKARNAEIERLECELVNARAASVRSIPENPYEGDDK